MVIETDAGYSTQLISGLTGTRTRAVWLAANTLVLNLYDAGTAREYTVWLDPAWHLARHETILVGSRELSDVDEEQFDTAAAVVRETLLDEEVRDAVLIQPGFDVRIDFARGAWVQTFATDAHETLSWYVDDKKASKFLTAGPAGFRVQEARR